MKKKEEEKENLKAQLVSKKEDFKSKSVMLKYQLIFIKVEIYLNNFASLFDLKEKKKLRGAFNQMKLANWSRKKTNQVVIQKIALDLELNLVRLALLFKRKARKNNILAFNFLKFQ